METQNWERFLRPDKNYDDDDNLTAIFEPNVQAIWDLRHLTTLQASTAW
jgi:hypothetical protein